jgi:aspartyl-tRNA(Asn)/glutamyl-tRNA(Gln) amidotransferase subunit B
MDKYQPTIGLEVHVELKTATKMFCRCQNNPDEKKPNFNICPVCLAHPGTLPAPNKKAIEHVLRVGLAVDGKLADYTEMDRKNYFYPDIPKGYQLSQYKYPLVSGGNLAGVELTRIHIEEDTARSQHDDKTGDSLVDFNRACVPLMELVTEPVIHDAKTASNFAKELQLLLSPLYLDASEANLEKGEMRVEANVSVALEDQPLGTKVEVKNLNSFKAVEKAIEFEVKRQSELLEKGEKIVQETRGWDEDKGITFSQRQKESSHDYRYFPDPDIPKMWLSKISEFASLNETLPELPRAKRERYAREFGIKAEDVEVFVTDNKLGDLFERTIELLGGEKEAVKILSNYLTSDLMGLVKNNQVKVWPDSVAMMELVNLITANEVSSRGAKDILAVMVVENKNPRAIAEEKGLFQKSDEGDLLQIIDQVIAENQKQVEDFKAGNEKVLQFLVGQGMKLSKGSANPGVLAELLKKKI